MTSKIQIGQNRKIQKIINIATLKNIQDIIMKKKNIILDLRVIQEKKIKFYLNPQT